MPFCSPSWCMELALVQKPCSGGDTWEGVHSSWPRGQGAEGTHRLHVVHMRGAEGVLWVTEKELRGMLWIPRLG